MGCNTFANGREVSGKASSGKTIAAFPDVCFTPPQTPATPPGVPIPYPNTGMASDTTGGTKKVKIGNKEVGIKNASCFKKSTGDEAGSAPKKGVVTSKNMGKVYFKAWSMDVKFEGKNAVRHLDLTTNNHGSDPGDTPPWPYASSSAIGTIPDCEEDNKRVNEDCRTSKPPKCTQKCKKAQKCALTPKSKDKQVCCADDTTGHHLIEVHCFSPVNFRGKKLEDLEAYSQSAAPCVCASQSRDDGTHGTLHAVQGKLEAAYNNSRPEPLCSWEPYEPGASASHSRWTYAEARDSGVTAHKIAFPHCNEKCVAAQLDAYHQDKCGIADDEPLRSDPGCDTRSCGDLTQAQQDQLNAAVDAVQGVGTSSTAV